MGFASALCDRSESVWRSINLQGIDPALFGQRGGSPTYRNPRSARRRMHAGRAKGVSK